jgi:hypothetical protein
MSRKAEVNWWLLVIVLIASIVSSYYIFMNKDKSPPISSPSSSEQDTLSSIVLERFPEGTEIKQGVSGQASTVFKTTDEMGVSGAKTSSKKSRLTIKIYNQSKELETVYEGMELNGAGTFSSCCIDFPQDAGKYTIKFYLDNKEVKYLDFEVIE